MDCIKCNKKNVDTRYSNKESMIKRQMCFSCNFWQDLVGNPKSVIINGDHYMISPESNDKKWSGHGGRQFNIMMNSGKKITTTNLWHQGEIPKEFKEEFPDNAELFKTVGEIAADKLDI